MSTKPVRLKVVKRAAPTVEIGAPGLKESAGFLQEEFVTDLRGQQGTQRYREMVDNCPAIDAALKVMKNLACRAIQDGRIEPYEDAKGGEDVARAEFVEQAFEDMAHSRSDMDDEALTSWEYGFAPLEIVYKRRNGYQTDEERSSRFTDGQVGWSKVSLRAQESVLRWDFDEYGRRLLGMVQIPAPAYTQFEIPIGRLALFRTSKVKGNPEGRSLLRAAYYAWKFFKRGTTVAWVGAERDVTGIPVLKGPADLFNPTPSAEQTAGFNQLKKIGENVKNDEQACVLIPSDVDPETKTPLYTFELLSSPGAKVMDVPAMTQAQERQMLMVLCSDWLLMGHEKIGTQALFVGREGVYARFLDSLLDRYDEVLNRQMIPRLALLNGWPMERLPQYKHGRVAETAMAELGAFLAQYTASGGLLDPDLDAYVRERVGWPAMSEDGLMLQTERPAPGDTDPEDEADDVPDDGKSEEKKPEVDE